MVSSPEGLPPPALRFISGLDGLGETDDRLLRRRLGRSGQRGPFVRSLQLELSKLRPGESASRCPFVPGSLRRTPKLRLPAERDLRLRRPWPQLVKAHGLGFEGKSLADFDRRKDCRCQDELTVEARAAVHSQVPSATISRQ